MNHVEGSLVGLSTGYQFSQFRRRETEVRQGANHLLAAFPQSSQVMALGSVVNELGHKMTNINLGFFMRITGIATQILAIPGCLFAGVVRSQGYTAFAEWVNRSTFLHLPTRLSAQMTSACNYIAENLGSFAHVAMIAGAVANAIFCNNIAFGAFILVSFGYENIDHNLGWVPHKVSLFVENYMPILSSICLILKGGLMLGISGAISLCSESDWLLTKVQIIIDRIICNRFSVCGPTVEEINEPVKMNKELSFDQINEILHSYEWDYELSPSHMSKWVHDLKDFPTDYNFQKYVNFFKEVNWREKYTFILLKVRDDDRFLDFLCEKFPKVNKEILVQKLEYYIEKLAEQKKLSKEEYLASWLQDNMYGFINTITSKRPIEGSRQDLEDAIENSSKILAYLGSLDRELEKVDFEDTLIALAVEGGMYCARGIKRCTSELLGKIAYRGFSDKDLKAMSPTQSFELQIMQELQNLRRMIVDEAYNEILKEIANNETKISQDVHVYDMYRLFLSYGFLPLTTFEKRKVGIAGLMVWELYRTYRNRMNVGYFTRLDQGISSLGELKIFDYIRQIIMKNPSLSKSQKNKILEMYTERNDDKWTLDETLSKFHRLMFVMLGVIRKRGKTA